MTVPRSSAMACSSCSTAVSCSTISSGFTSQPVYLVPSPSCPVAQGSASQRRGLVRQGPATSAALPVRKVLLELEACLSDRPFELTDVVQQRCQRSRRCHRGCRNRRLWRCSRLHRGGLRPHAPGERVLRRGAAASWRLCWSAGSSVRVVVCGVYCDVIAVAVTSARNDFY